MKKLKAEFKNGRLCVEYMGQRYVLSVDSEGKLRLSVPDGSLVVRPMAMNSVTLENEK